MSKLQNIKNAVKEGKGSVKMIEYLLWREQEISFVSWIFQNCAQLSPTMNRQQINTAHNILDLLKEVDAGKMTIAEYDEKKAFWLNHGGVKF